MSRLDFLRANRLFETTTLTGFAFIALSKTKVEVIFWYAVIITMTIMTIVNVYGATVHYLSKPTKTYVEAATSTENTSIADLKFELNMSLIEFTRLNPTGLSYKEIEIEDMVVQNLACNAMVPAHERYFDIESEAIHYVVIEWIESLVSSWDEFGTEITEISQIGHLSDKKIFSQWLEELAARGTDLYNHLWENRWNELSAEAKEFDIKVKDDPAIMEALRLLNRPLESRSQYTPYYLMLLKALQDDSDPRKLLFQHLRGRAHKTTVRKLGVVVGQNGSNYDSTATELLKELGMTASEVLEAINQGLEEIIHFNIESDSTPSNIPVFVFDWTYDTNTWMAPHRPGLVQHPFTEGWQMFGLKIHVPDNSNEIHMSIYSYNFVWFYHIVMAFQEYFDRFIALQFTMPIDQFFNNMEKLDQHECNNPNGSFEPFDSRVLLDFLESHYLSRTSLILANDRGSGIEMQPFRVYTVTIKPTMHFHSKTEACEPNSPENCLDECLAKSYEEKCGCIPWQLHYIKREPICNTPCVDEEQPSACTDHCRQQLEHPCALSLYQFETVSRRMRGELRADRPIFEMHIAKAKVFNHPHFIEEYEMSLGDFTAQLGGLMEFWIGINVIGILHIFVYMFKQIYKTRFSKRDNKISGTTDGEPKADDFSAEYRILVAQVERRLTESREETKKDICDNNATMTAEFRKAIKDEIENLKAEMLLMLNSSDGSHKATDIA